MKHQITAILVLSLITVSFGFADAKDGKKSSKKTPNSAAAVVTPGKVNIEEIKAGDGAAAGPGKTVTLHYTGWLTNGKKFDSSRDSGKPFTFTFGKNEVIPGYEKGLNGMKVHGKRKITIPSDLAYGERGAGNGVIPPNATLVFEIELLDVK